VKKAKLAALLLDACCFHCCAACAIWPKSYAILSFYCRCSVVALPFVAAACVAACQVKIISNKKSPTKNR